MRHFILLICLLSVAFAQSQQGFAFTRFSTEDRAGLASNVIHSMYADKKGFIWIGTDNGLQRFDGDKFIRPFRTSTNPSAGVPFAAITQILDVNERELGLYMQDIRQIAFFDPVKFTYRPADIRFNANKHYRREMRMWKTHDGKLYLVALNNGILEYNAQQHAFLDNNPFKLPEGYSPSPTGVFDDTIQQRVWIACRQGLVVYDRRSGQAWHKNFNPQHLPLLETEILNDRPTSFFIDRHRRYWIFGWPAANASGAQERYCVDSTGRFLSSDTAGLSTTPEGYREHNNFLETRKGDFWIYGVDLLMNYDSTQRRFNFISSSQFGSSMNIQYNLVNQMIEDREGNIWIATNRGLYFTDPKTGGHTLVNYTFQTPNAYDLLDVIEISPGRYWFATWGRGILEINERWQERQLPFFTKTPDNWPKLAKTAMNLSWSFCKKPGSDSIIMTCNGGVIIIMNPLTGKGNYQYVEASKGYTLHCSTTDSKGQVWLGSFGGHLLRSKGNSYEEILKVNAVIFNIFFDDQGWIWMSTDSQGLYAVDPVTGKILQHYTVGHGDTGLFAEGGDGIAQLNDSTIAFGAGALNLINKKTGKVKVIGYEQGLASNNIKRLRKDSNGYLWIITSAGLSRYNPGNGRVTHYGRKDGIVQASQTSVSDLMTTDGRIMFAGNTAMLLFDPAEFNTHVKPPSVSITDFKLFNDFMPLDSLLQLPRIELGPDQNSFSIFFSSLSFTERDKLTYHYRMEGLDKEWKIVDRNDYENYQLLPPGKYRFQVYAENVEGLRSEQIKELLIYIRPPFWRTAWFITLMLLMACLLIYWLHTMRVKGLLAVEKVRNRVARDLHDDMGSTLSTINILSSMAKTKIGTDPVKATEYIGKISDNSQRMMESMDDIVWSIKPSNDSMFKIIARMREFAINVLEPKDIVPDLVAAEEVYTVKLDMETRRDFFLVFKEALNNSAKYSRATAVTAKIDVTEKGLEMIVEDNGIGFDVKNADEGNGLNNMQKRAEHMKATLTIHSQAGEGTRIHLVVPL